MRFSSPSPSARRALIAIAVALAPLSACGRNVAKADAAEQQADAFMAAGNFFMAGVKMERSIKNDANEPRRWLKLGRAQRAANLTAQAAESYQHALDLDPANIEALENLSILLVRAGRYTEARTYVDPLMALSPDDVAGLLALGAIEMYGKRFDAANRYADRLIAIAPESIGGYSLKAQVLAAQGRPNAAAAMLAKQLALNPTDVDIALQLMDLYKVAGNRKGVRDTSIVLAKLVPGDPRYEMESARAQWAAGQRAEAERAIAAIQQRYRGNPAVIRAVADFWFGALPRAEALTRVQAMTETAAGRSKAALGELLVGIGEAPAAVRLLGPAATGKVDASSADLHASYAAALLATGKAGEARNRAQQVLGFDPTNDGALVIRARTSFALRDYDEALNDAQLAVSSNAGNEAAWLLIPRAYQALGRIALVDKAWGDGQSNLPNSVAIFRGRMAWLVSRKRLDDAVAGAAVFARAHPGDAEVWRTYRDLCVAADDACAAPAAATLRRMGAA